MILETKVDATLRMTARRAASWLAILASSYLAIRILQGLLSHA